ncbi:MAG TPA: hypothetical protein VGS12_17825 [Caulobacteraceae bacterium]|nr:hypothetical protein [Caulobacteraceae bacterium]
MLRLAFCLAAMLGAAACHRAAGQNIGPADATGIACVNPASGFAWTFKLDPASHSVDGSPASFGGDRIAWADESGAAFEFKPDSGDLTVTRASSTGGYIVRDRCRFVR